MEDRGSTNGTFVNDEPVTVPVPIHKGDRLVFGSVETIFDKPDIPKTAITRSMPWAVVDESGRFALSEKGVGRSTLSLIFEIGESLEQLTDQTKLLSRFSKILTDYVDAEYSGFFAGKLGPSKYNIAQWFHADSPVDGRELGLYYDSFAEDMVIEGTAFVTDLAEVKEAGSKMYVPISAEGGVDGFLVCVGSEFSDNALRLCTVLARFIGLSLARAKLIRTQGEATHSIAMADDVWIGESEESWRVLSLATKYSFGDSPVVIEGKSGTGKELIARFIHSLSDRRDGPFVAFNCAALNENLAESELFGHVKGAFTDADKDRRGLFEQAHEGMVFLDEIGELSLGLQAKLLRVLETKRVRPVGGEKDLDSNFRVLCATNRDLAALVHEKLFRADLYYRLNVLRIHIEPLQRRSDDIPPLVRHYLAAFSSRLGKSGLTVSPGCMETLMDYRWPGNVRELKNAVERAVYAAKGTVLEAEDFELPVVSQSQTLETIDGKSLGEILAQVERQAIQNALEYHHWSKTKTATHLGITRQTLDRKIALYDLDS